MQHKWAQELLSWLTQRVEEVTVGVAVVRAAQAGDSCLAVDVIFHQRAQLRFFQR